MLENGISVILLAYREEENLRVLIPQIKENLEKIGEEYEILVIDTAKPLDNTKDVCVELDALYINQEEPFFGGAFKTGIKYASKEKFLILDSDCSHDPAVIPAIHEKFVNGGYDVVIGSRYTEGGKTNDSKMSIFMSKTLNTAFRIGLGIKAKDISTDYRMYYTTQLKKLQLEFKNYDILQEVLVRLKLNKPDLSLKIGEVPITFNKRQFGDSKRRLLPFIIGYMRALVKLTFLSRFGLVRNIFLYGVIGGGGAVIDYGIFSLLTYLAFFNYPQISNLIGSLLGFAFTFTMNTRYNFNKTDKIMKRLLSYGTICLIGIGITTLSLSLFAQSMNLYALKAITLLIVSILQFVLNKTITYGRIK
jgi:dolichol-phosphate mannosyltransferase